MRKKLNPLAQKIALTALASITGNVSANSVGNSPSISEGLEEAKSLFFADKPNLLLKRPALDFNRYAENPNSHRSHRSHSSHRSHYSGSSGSSKTKPSSSGRSSNSNSSSNSSQRLYTPPETTNTSYSLGDRILKEGMTGSDVVELKNKLNQKGYYSEIGSFSSYFNDKTTEALKQFQKDYGLSIDGIAGQSTFLYLNYDLQKPASKSTKTEETPIVYTPPQEFQKNESSDKEAGKTFYLTESTSLRNAANSKAIVLKRFQAGDKVTILDSTSNEFWWEVTDIETGKKGWVKRHLLKR